MQPPQPPHSPGPVYQQLSNVSRTSFSTAEMLASSSSHSASTYQTANNDRQSQPIVAQRTQYYPRYHHPDITKCAPAPYSQSSIYQSANVAQPSSMAQQPSTRSTPIEQNNTTTSSNVVTQGHCPSEQQRIPGTYGSNIPLTQNSLGGSTAYGSGSATSSQSYRSTSQYQQQVHVWPLPLRVSTTGRIARMGCTLPPRPAPHRRRRSARVSPGQEAPPPITFLRNRSRRIFRVTFLHRICRPPPLRCTIISTSSTSSNSNSSSNNISNRRLCSSNSSILVV
ncbi:BCL-6 corepressor [Temnothorax longispinosus]|uniref:BCL-6 corepressor n=1 Tax=Temnothorax longispinosus TaxID=300112 RepID=A0A4S2JSM1_9HYME|nr:BCL-6 corepressor [Temnothorax longispinosus]